MPANKKNVATLKYEGPDKTIGALNSLMSSTTKPDLIYVEVDTKEFPNRIFDLPKEFVKFLNQHPEVKCAWDGGNSLGDDFTHKQDESGSKHYFFKIIIPNYNNQLYIEDCLNSILNQTFQDFICVIVDDSSTDDSPRIIEQYAIRYPEKFKFIRLTDKRYAGGARNAGLDYPVESEYIQFIDGDDLLYSDNSLKILYDNLSDLKTDILVFNWVRTKENSLECVKSEADGKTFASLMNRLGNCPWNGAPLHTMRRSMVERFIEKCGYGEDTMSWMKSWNHEVIPSYKQLQDIIYVYRTNPTSTVQTWHKFHTGIRESTQELFYREMREFAKECKNEYIANSISNRILPNCSQELKQQILDNIHESQFFKSKKPLPVNTFREKVDNGIMYLSNRPIQWILRPSIDMNKCGLNLLPHKFIDRIFTKSSIDDKVDNAKKYNCAFIWGNNLSEHNRHTIDYLFKHPETVMLLCEDGFIRSYDTWVNKDAAPELLQSCSLIVDTLGYYFDATKPTLIETLLNDKHLVLTDFQKAFARRMISKITKNKISKYNHQPIDVKLTNIGSHERKILVVDQSYGDFSINRGLASDDTFKSMLDDAINNNQDADILVKTHPDAMVGNGVKKGYYQGMKQHHNIFPVTQPINPYTLLEYVDEVYVCTSQYGFEALLAGKKVTTYGVPFYSNWGVTIDKQKVDRRQNTRTIEEIFYIFYIIYTFWYNPETNMCSNIEDIIDYIIKLRDQQWKKQ